MAEYLSPGVYIEEIDSGPKPIEGVSTSTAGMVGMTVRGPIVGPPKLVTSFADYQRRYGGYLPDSFGDNRWLPYAVRAFFENGGKRVYIARVIGPGSATASVTPPTGIQTRLTKNLASGSDKAFLRTLRGVGMAANTSVTLKQIREGITTEHTVQIKNYNPNGEVTLNSNIPDGLNFDTRFTSVILDIPTGPFDPLMVLKAADPGAWGNDLQVQISHTSLTHAQVVSLGKTDPMLANFDSVELNTTNRFYVGAIIEFERRGSSTPPGAANDKIYARVTAIDGNRISIEPALADLDALKPREAGIPTTASTVEFGLTASYNGITESYPTLTLDENTPYYYKTSINNNSSLLVAEEVPPPPGPPPPPSPPETHPFRMPNGDDGLNVMFVGGADGNTPDDNAYIGADLGPGKRTGIQALTDIDQVSIVTVPGVTTQPVQDALISHCELLLDRFAILDPEYSNNESLDDIRDQRDRYDTKYAALYFPNLLALDPVSGLEIELPPSGHMAGIYARTDIERGVHKAPANVVVRGITGLDLIVNQAEQDILNPKNINVIRDFRASNRGLRVWGSRCLTSDASWKYIPVRRLFIFVEESLNEGLQWVVFEPNDEALWARVRQSISNFLIRVWRDGALMGVKQEEAFFVRCDRTTMTQDDIDNGRLIVQVGIAPVKPAEFVIVRIQQFTAEANTAA